MRSSQFPPAAPSSSCGAFTCAGIARLSRSALGLVALAGVASLGLLLAPAELCAGPADPAGSLAASRPLDALTPPAPRGARAAEPLDRALDSGDLRAAGILDYGLQIRLPQPEDDLLGQLTLAHRIPGGQVVRYRGLQGFLVRQMRRAYQSRWRRSLRDTYDAGGLDTFALASRYQAMGEAEADLAAGGRWWTRAWQESLTPERGGAPQRPWSEDVGTQVTMVSVGPFSLTNDFRVRLDGGYFGLKIDPSPSRVFRDLAEVDVARDYATYQRQTGDDESLPDQRALEDQDEEDTRAEAEARRAGPDRLHLSSAGVLELQVAALVPQPDLAWRINVRPEARVRVRPGQPLRARVGIRAAVEFSMGPPRARQRVIEVVGRVRYDLHDRDLVATFQLQFVAW